jgi:tetratricopeptide (TPR) repeat protein
MWQMALAIDGGDASLAEQRLREARDALREALRNGASQEEIAKLTDELRKAMDEYMQALAEQMRDNPNLSQQLTPQDMQRMQEISPEDFQKMIDRMEQLSELGDREAAEQLLSELDRMLENLQTAQPRQSPQGQQGEQGEMNQMMKQLQQGGMDPGEPLGEAGKSMGEAEGSLGEGEAGEALGQQGRALEQLRQGAQQLAEQMQGQGEGEGPGQRGRTSYSEDPLGRPQRRDGPDFGDSVKVPGEIDVQRARRILEELRRRFSDETRPTFELDYLRRLLTPF